MAQVQAITAQLKTTASQPQEQKAAFAPPEQKTSFDKVSFPLFLEFNIFNSTGSLVDSLVDNWMSSRCWGETVQIVSSSMWRLPSCFYRLSIFWSLLKLILNSLVHFNIFPASNLFFNSRAVKILVSSSIKYGKNSKLTVIPFRSC